MIVSAKILESFDVISFDIFGTLLLRPFIEAKDLYSYIEWKCCLPGFSKKREKASESARRKVLNLGKKERTLDDIYEFLDGYSSLDELRCERELLVGNPDTIEIFNWAKNAGKKVVIVSDMYLPPTVISEILKSNGIDGWNAMYISSECGVTKSGGELFDIMLNDLKVAASAVLHIGDDLHSDIDVFEKKGGGTFVYVNPIDKFLSSNSFAHKYLRLHNDIRGKLLVGAVAIANHVSMRRFTSGEDDAYAVQMANFIALVAGYAYCLFIGQDAVANGIRQILFLARDGYNLEPIFNLLFPQIKTQYVYAPRQDFVKAFLNFKDNSFAGTKASNGNVHRRIEIEGLHEFYQGEEGWSAQAETNFLKDGTIDKELNYAIGKLSEHIKKEYSYYISSLGLDGSEPLGLVDLTTVRGTARKFMQCFTRQKIRGYYFLRHKGIWTDGDFSNTASFYHAHGSSVLLCDIIEYLLSAPTNMITGIRGGVPVYKKCSDIYEDYKHEIARKVRSVIEVSARLFVRWGVQIDRVEASDWFECYASSLNIIDRSRMSFMREAHGVDDSDRHSVWHVLKIRDRVDKHHFFTNKVIVSVQTVVEKARRYRIYKLFGRIAFLRREVEL